MKQQEFEIKYIELKSGFRDNGPAWIGKVKISRSGNTLYFNNKAFRKNLGNGWNHYDIETRDKYWISSVKKDGTDRHWAGGGKIMIDDKIINDYLKIIGKNELNMSRFEIINIEDSFPVERINMLENNSK